jgi:hypothetical protein
MPWSDFFYVGDRVCPAGRAAALAAIHAHRVGHRDGVLRNARLAMEADRKANAARASGRVLQRGNVIGNAWSGWYESITGLPSGW